MIQSFRGKYEFLSNMYRCEIEEDGIKYRSSENYFQAMKSNDPEVRKMIGNLHPIDSKKAGRKIDLNPAEWNSKKVLVMLNALRLKFKDPVLKAKLLETGYSKIVEGNTWNDTYWGVCNGKGLNVLGELLMKVREELQEE